MAAENPIILLEAAMLLPVSIVSPGDMSPAMEEFCRDFDEHTLQQLKQQLPWLEDLYEECNGLSDEEDFDDADFAEGIFKAVKDGKAKGWLIKSRVPEPPHNSFGRSWGLWTYGETFEGAFGAAILEAKHLCAKALAKVKP